MTRAQATALVYDIPALTARCEAFIVEELLDSSCVIELLRFADLHHATFLKKCCLHHIRRHQNEISEQDMELLTPQQRDEVQRVLDAL
jgi:hypothetical protein